MNYFLSLIAATASEAEPQPVAEFEFPWTMVITLGISLLLLFVFIVMILPRKKISPAVYASSSVAKCLAAAERFAAEPDRDNLKRLKKAASFAENALTAAVYKGLVELNPAQAIQEETVKICKSLAVTKADRERRAEFAEIILANTRHIVAIIAPYAKNEVDDGLIALNQRNGANAYLSSVRTKHGAPPTENFEDVPEVKRKDDDEDRQ